MHVDVIVFDEIGRYELDGKGFDRAFRYAVEHYRGAVLAVIREENIRAVCEQYGINIESCTVINAHDEIQESYERIRNL